MHGALATNRTLVESLVSAGFPGNIEVAVLPPHAYLQQVLALCANSDISVGAQDCSHMPEGAYTGEVAAPMLADIGCKWVVIGHSERRQYHRETSSLIAAKLTVAVAAGLKPVLCIGETLDERESGEAESVVLEQLRGAIADAPSTSDLVIAYEPVWAIGTGRTATPDEAQEMHAFIRSQLKGLNAADDKIRVVYGGSVKADNAHALFACEDIDGALVGGASLQADEFAAIVGAAAAA